MWQDPYKDFTILFNFMCSQALPKNLMVSSTLKLISFLRFQDLCLMRLVKKLYICHALWLYVLERHKACKTINFWAPRRITLWGVMTGAPNTGLPGGPFWTSTKSWIFHPKVSVGVFSITVGDQRNSSIEWSCSSLTKLQRHGV